MAFRSSERLFCFLLLCTSAVIPSFLADASDTFPKSPPRSVMQSFTSSNTQILKSSFRHSLPEQSPALRSVCFLANHVLQLPRFSGFDLRSATKPSSFRTTSPACLAKHTHLQARQRPSVGLLKAQDESLLSPPIDIPVIDLTPFTTGGGVQQKQKVGRQVQEACKKFGVFYVTGHGIAEHDLRAVFQASKEFFNLPMEAKREVPFLSGGFTRGYIGIGEESGSDMYEAKEAFSYGFDWDPEEKPENPLQGPNEWPKQQSGLNNDWRTTMNDYYMSNCKVASALTSALAMSLNLDEEAFDDLCTGGDTISLMRLFHYLPQHSPETLEGTTSGRSVTGSSPHTDWGWLTVILQDPSVVALELRHGGRWHAIPPKPNTLLVNIGDYVALMTGGEYISPLHRVVSGAKERFSFVFFSYPGYDAKLPRVNIEEGKELSLLKDQSFQSASASSGSGVEVPAFGAFISQKWEQVQRK